MSKNCSSPSPQADGQTALLEDRLFEIFMERFKKFSLEFKSRNSHTFPASEHFTDNDSSMTHISFGEQDMRNAWLSHLRRLGCKVGYTRSSEDGNMYVRDYSDPVVNGRFIEIPRDVAIRMLALGHLP